jgi:hypothetical protein
MNLPNTPLWLDRLWIIGDLAFAVLHIALGDYWRAAVLALCAAVLWGLNWIEDRPVWPVRKGR